MKPTNEERIEAIQNALSGLTRSTAMYMAVKMVEADPLTKWADDIEAEETAGKYIITAIKETPNADK